MGGGLGEEGLPGGRADDAVHGQSLSGLERSDRGVGLRAELAVRREAERTLRYLQAQDSPNLVHAEHRFGFKQWR